MSDSIKSIARFIHMYNIGVVFVVVYAFLRIGAQVISAQSAMVISAFNTLGEHYIFLFLFIGITTFVFNTAFYRGVSNGV